MKTELTIDQLKEKLDAEIENYAGKVGENWGGFHFILSNYVIEDDGYGYANMEFYYNNAGQVLAHSCYLAEMWLWENTEMLAKQLKLEYGDTAIIYKKYGDINIQEEN